MNRINIYQSATLYSKALNNLPIRELRLFGVLVGRLRIPSDVKICASEIDYLAKGEDAIRKKPDHDTTFGAPAVSGQCSFILHFH